jgi:glycine cleavage system pyridoxal-binding protein P
MLAVIGAQSEEDLVAYLPADVRFQKRLAIEDGKSEYEIVDYFKQLAGRNAAGYPSFLGAGVYNHFRPVLVDAVVSRGEFLTSYTPYQAEISQGTLTSIFEFQTMVCQLTGMEVANASMYDGSSAVPEAAMMAVRITGRDKVLIARSVHPEYREVLRTCTQHQGMPVEELAYDADGNRAFCLTLATREQHIRREKATSNICTNQALLALMATVFMSVYGKEGLRELAEQNLAKAHYMAGKLPLKFDAPFFNEFVVRTNGKSPDQINARLLDQKIIGGLALRRFYPELSDCMLLCATEMSRRQDMDAVAAAFSGH